MKIVYANDKIKIQCTNLKEATKLFGSNKDLASRLFSSFLEFSIFRVRKL